MNRNSVVFFVALLTFGIFLSCGYADRLPKCFLFDKEDALIEWKEKIFRGKVLYEIKKDSGKNFLSAKSDKSSSGLFCKISFNPRNRPFISWNWKVSKFPSLAQGNNLTKKGWIECDDYAARVYIIFPSFIFTGTECLEYVWSQDLPRGEILTSPFFKNIKLIVVESGSENLDKWVYVERNISEDYKMAFGRPLRKDVGAIALMTDSDNTQSSALGHYADIKVGYAVAYSVSDVKAEPKSMETKAAQTASFLKYIKSILSKIINNKK